MSQPNPRLSSLFELEYPQSVGVFDSYAQAQAAVDFLADAKFPVENLAIVGTDLKSVERVTGRRSWGNVLLSGVQSGLSTGLMVALILWFLQPGSNPLALLPGALLIGILIGVAFAAVGYAASRGKRDFKSISQTVAARYEVLCEHKVAGQARELLATMPGARAAAFDPRNAAPPWQAPSGAQLGGQAGSYPGVPGGQPRAYPGAQGQPWANPAAYPASGQPGGPAQPGYGAGQPAPGATRPDDPAHPARAVQTPSAPPQSGESGQAYGQYGPAEGIGRPPESDEPGRSG